MRIKIRHYRSTLHKRKWRYELRLQEQDENGEWVDTGAYLSSDRFHTNRQAKEQALMFVGSNPFVEEHKYYKLEPLDIETWRED